MFVLLASCTLSWTGDDTVVGVGGVIYGVGGRRCRRRCCDRAV